MATTYDTGSIIDLHRRKEAEIRERDHATATQKDTNSTPQKKR